MAHFDLSNYATVAERITQFYADHPDGRIHTRLLNTTDGKQAQFIVHAEIYIGDDERPVATGLAEEHFTDRGPNETSPLENAETSAIGRALVNWKYSSTAADRPSREEMSKVNNNSKQGVPPQVKDAIKSTSPKHEVNADSRWETIKQGAAADPSNTFLSDLVKKGEQYGNLSEKQLGAGFNAARKVLDAATPRANDVIQAFPGATEVLPGEEPF